MLRPFDVVFPGTAAEASAELARLNGRAKLYSGGVEVVLGIRQGILKPDYLVDVKGLPGVRDLGAEGDGVRIGAAVTHRRVHSDPLVRERLPLLSRAAQQIANVRVRNQGTLGGNISYCDPHSDPMTPLLVHEATVTAESSRGSRVLAFDDFVTGMWTTALEPDELVTSIVLQPLPGWSVEYRRLARFERPTLSTAVALRTDAGRVAEARVAVGGLGQRARRLPELEQRLQGVTADEVAGAVAGARRGLAETLAPVDDLTGSAEYKLHLAGVLVRRAVTAALEGSA
jgi:carbon-monoxide dehydrogenase medium subunit